MKNEPLNRQNNDSSATGFFRRSRKRGRTGGAETGNMTDHTMEALEAGGEEFSSAGAGLPAEGGETSAEGAETSAGRAELSAVQAETSADRTELSAIQAETSANRTETSSDGAETFADRTETSAAGAELSAIQAETFAERAELSAESEHEQDEPTPEESDGGPTPDSDLPAALPEPGEDAAEGFEPAPTSPQADYRVPPRKWFITFMCMNIPVIGWIYLLVKAFGRKNTQLKDFARAYLLYKLVFLLVALIILGLAVYVGLGLLDELLAYMEML